LFIEAVALIALLGGSLVAAQNSPDRLRSLVEQAAAAEQQNRLDEAVALYREILRIRPGWASAELNLGLVYHSRADYTNAIQLLTKALRHNPDLHSALLFRGASYYQTGRYQAAVADLEQYLKHRPDDVEALSYLASVHRGRNDPARAALAYEALARVSNQPSAYFQLSECYVQLARDVMTQSSEPAQPSEKVEAYRKLAQAAADKVFALGPESSWAKLLRAQAAEQSGQIDVAEKEFERAIGAPDAGFEALVRFGQFLAKRSQFDRGLELYERAARLEPQNARVKGLIGEIHALENRSEKAVPYLESALKANPHETQTRLYLAQSLVKLSRAQEAIKILQAAPEDPDGRVHYLLGRTYQQQGQTAKAGKAMEEFRKRRKPVKP
jgi:tetratricopeptide (TPR) repeat protein